VRLGARRATDRVAGDDRRGVLECEIARARRYERPFALVRLPWGGTNGGRPDLKALVRSIDACIDERSSTVLLLPECEREAGNRLVERLAAAFPAFRWTETARVAVFPEDGLTLEALDEALSSVLRGRDEMTRDLLRPGPAVVPETSKSG
jgi:hypothetical protein